MPTGSRPGDAEETSGCLNFARELSGKLGPGPDPELCVDVRQVARHGALAEEQAGGDLAVRPALGDERGDAQLRRAQAGDARTPTDAGELRPRRGCPAGGAEGLEPGERGFERLAGAALLARPAAIHAQGELGPGSAKRIAD